MSVLDNADGSFVVLTNNKRERSLWPEFKDVPDGWSVAFGPDSRQACLMWVEEDSAADHVAR